MPASVTENLELFAAESIDLQFPESHDEQGDIDAFIAALERKYRDRIVARVDLPAQEARYADFPEGLDPGLCAALAARGIDRLYSHQRTAIDHALAGRHVVIATPTASGKSLCYHLPALQRFRRDGAKALYLFPTKALAQDQVADLLEINRAGSLGLRTYTFDGDTPNDARQAIRRHGDLVVTNPDMLHQGILPHHTKWAQFFENLDTIVIDELHTYRGVFGSHLANVIRRLKRVLRFYGADPVFILCSATIANPAELASRLIGESVVAVDESGAPQGAKTLLMWNPPVVNADLGLRASARSQTLRIVRQSLKRGFKTIAFANSRLETEVITKYLKDVCDADPRKPARVAGYRGGYLPTERRDKERKLRAGHLDCVVSTSALELGVDIGALDICVLNGYPGSIAAAWQRLGRAGRRSRASLGGMVAPSQLLDQYLARHPQFFLGASPERARIDPDQLLILMEHLRCAAFELPFVQGESFGKEDLATLLAYLEEQGVLHREGASWHWITDSYPANAVNLRGTADGNFAVIETTDGRKDVIAEVDFSSAPLTLYEGAIYLLQALPYQVERLDWGGRKAFVKRVQADYYTDAIDYTKLKILDEFERQEQAQRGHCAHGEVHVVRRVAGYKKIRFGSHENIGYGPVNLPDHEMHTAALWWQLDETTLDKHFLKRQEALDGFLGAAYALHHVAALLSMADPRDFGRAVGDGAGTWSAVSGADGRGSLKSLGGQDMGDALAMPRFRPTVFLYDNHPGGMGLVAPLYEIRGELVERTLALVRDCACAEGCPACVGPVIGYTGPAARTSRQSALAILGLLEEQS
ncbi:MAG: DEAD/DEAH box helicase [Proteobacteria bacterium]|nr:DEAD/DEAH box helicase [Pseudomonadota bacterium]